MTTTPEPIVRTVQIRRFRPRRMLTLDNWRTIVTRMTPLKTPEARLLCAVISQEIAEHQQGTARGGNIPLQTMGEWLTGSVCAAYCALLRINHLALLQMVERAGELYLAEGGTLEHVMSRIRAAA